MHRTQKCTGLGQLTHLSHWQIELLLQIRWALTYLSVPAAQAEAVIVISQSTTAARKADLHKRLDGSLWSKGNSRAFALFVFTSKAKKADRMFHIYSSYNIV